MKITILGTRGEIDASAPYHSKHSGVLVDNRLMLDLGERSFLKHKPDHILFTHLHPDHAFFVRKDNEAEIDIPMYAPEPYEGEGIKIEKFGTRRKLGDYRVRAIETIHSLKVKSHAYLIKKGDKRILYTGDMIWIEKSQHKHFGELDLVITEGSFVRKDGMIRRDEESGKIFGHAGIPRLISLFKDFTDRIVLVHFGSWLYKDIKEARRRIGELADEHEVEIEVGYDGLEITV